MRASEHESFLNIAGVKVAIMAAVPTNALGVGSWHASIDAALFLLNQVRPDPDAGLVAALARTGAADAALRALELLADTAERQPFPQLAADSGVGTLSVDGACTCIAL